ncbi:ABC transporter ATP-binding protein [Bosea psychrotolerans]|uniref:Peptide/nickel transport system ATP-binding protein n=1 Tax=Bosea psychrotolerans TaxID=1871628 RepID=A0A2S4LWW0_9HYPH|nr:ABC transporter ATP-binding protein [Bosea psychrotolerans]POR46940.1 peptide/nickel transport system ATP-binding protein [Bosea psychrotolerans]
MAPLLDIAKLSLSFRTESGPARVLDQIDLLVQPGEIVGLVGESGCGKTTLARAILGTLPERLTEIGSGHIRLDGVDMLRDDQATERLRGRVVTFVPQDPFASFNPLFRIRAQIGDLMRWKTPRRTASRFGWRSRAEQKADDEAVLAMLDTVQLPQPRRILEKYPHELSGGQRQRVMIAMALLPEPRLIIADEPTTALDVTVQAQILGLLRRLAVERGVSVLFTTHDLGAAWEICDRVVVMYAGQTAEIAPREAFFAHPRHPYTRMLLQSLPEEGRDAVGIPGAVPSPLQPPPGCRFNPRCPRMTGICRDERPALSGQHGAHQVACHHPVAVSEVAGNV